VLEAANDAGLDTSRVRRLGLPDRSSNTASASELLADLGLDAIGVAAACRRLATGSLEAQPLPSRADDRSAACNPTV
jgi:1-deoxy-D-xylulose-5-phosphate synthase